jgi:hypothetical protein
VNTWQVLRQAKSILEAAVWPGASGGVVFGAVKVTPGALADRIAQLRMPLVQIKPTSSTTDPEEPGLITQNLDCQLAIRMAADAWGEAALLGGPRGAQQTGSSGRGLLEVEEELLRALKSLQEVNGVRLKLLSKSAVAATLDPAQQYVAFRDYSFEIWTTAERSYEEPTRFTGVDATGGQATLAWTLPASRFDLREVILRRAAGATPPATPTAGTGVTLASLLATGVTDSPGAGTFSYSLFAGYDEFTKGSSDRFSAAVTVASLVVT